ncbi:hypothetical protein [Baekduia sp.]|jgi:hydroxymethylpyrimidine pyrophosphatase-like HAD family hydrolase|uniref:HAD family hydrolase n=1 Tax=Baekduia sp. TaxID=2600305 RepID=UPI002E121999
MTHRNPSDVALPEAKVIGLPPLTLREGFLAVNSVMSMASAMVRGYAGEVLPVTLAEAEADPWPTAVDRLLVLFPPSLAAVATDLETRVSELGLAAVQLADYRNFAHGRHTGLDRTLDRTTIVALSDKESRPLADATLKALPDQASIVRWNSQAAWPTSALELLQVSLRASGKLGAAQNVSMARPKVPLFGRRLYRLPLRKRIPDVLNGSVDRKLDAAGGALIGDELRNRYETAFDAWKKSVAEVRFHGLVVDYDGTVCTTEGRFFPPEPLIAEQMNRLLGEGLSLGFASGRGPSLHRDLREVIDTAHWSKVQLGLYNGGYLTTLADELEDLTEPNGLIEEAVARIETLPVAAALRRVPRRVQLTLEPADGARVNPSKLAAVVQEVLARDPPVPVRVVRSGHSLDIVPASTTKVAVRDRLTALTYGEILAVGDQGQVGGNDFELLAASPWTVSVERCSADPTRCWYVGDGSDSGPRLLVRYLRSLVKRRSGFAFRVGGLS